ncbi:UNVERIFIED_CONTAM: Spindle and kinetochore-associated protein 1 [Siphonaria sp. JEL0065]|nr:Spindle and kinetochore-associated protein 1 [Siphonaria sp. JEL0065]
MDDTTPLTSLSRAVASLEILVTAAQNKTLRPDGVPVDSIFANAVDALFDAECRTRSLNGELKQRKLNFEKEQKQRESDDARTTLALKHAAAFLANFSLEKLVAENVIRLEKINQLSQKQQMQQQMQEQMHQKNFQHQHQSIQQNEHQEEDADDTQQQQQQQQQDQPEESIPQPVAKKMQTSISLLSDSEFDALPKYLLNRLTLDKINASLSEFNKLVSTKYTSLKIPHAKMNKLQRDRFWEHKKSCNDATKGKAFLMEREIKDGWWSAGAVNGRVDKNSMGFKLDPLGRSVLALARHLGRIKEVRGGGDTRIVIM